MNETGGVAFVLSVCFLGGVLVQARGVSLPAFFGRGCELDEYKWPTN